MTKQIHPASIFPPSWRDCCYRVMQIYLELQEEKTGRKLGSTRLARAMREPHTVPGNDWANGRLEEEFTRQDVEAWLNRGVEFSDRKFKFVDAFVRQLAIGDYGTEIRELMKDERIRRTCKSLRDLLGLDFTESAYEVGPPLYEGLKFKAQLRGRERMSCIFQITAQHEKVVHADLLLLPRDPDAKNSEKGSKAEKVNAQMPAEQIVHLYLIATNLDASDPATRKLKGSALIVDDTRDVTKGRFVGSNGFLIFGFYTADNTVHLMRSTTFFHRAALFVPLEDGTTNHALRFGKYDGEDFDDQFHKLRLGYLQ